MNKLLIIVVTYNGMRDIDNCLSSIDPRSPDIQGLVIDNGSTDGTVEHIKLLYPHLQLIETGRNLGFGAANNIGMRYAMENNFEYVYLLNQDAWISPEEINRMLEIADKNLDFAIISPLHVYENCKELDFNFSNCIPYEIKNDFIAGDEKKELYDVKVHRIPAAHWLVRVRALNTVGLFSPTFYHYAEDDNMIDRVLYHGYKTGIAPGVKGVHNRRDRKRSPQLILYLAREQWCRILSNPNRSKLDALRGVSVEVYKSLVYHGFTTLSMLLNVTGRYRTILKNRKVSMAEAAFIKRS